MKCCDDVGYLRDENARLEGEVAALGAAAIQPRPNGHKWCALCGMWAQRDQEIDHARNCVLAALEVT